MSLLKKFFSKDKKEEKDRYLKEFEDMVSQNTSEFEKVKKARKIEEEKEHEKRNKEFFREGYKRGKKEGHIEYSDLKIKDFVKNDLEVLGNKILQDKENYNQKTGSKNRGYALGLARQLMGEADERVKQKGYFSINANPLMGARIYKQLGLGGKPSVKRKLLKAIEKDVQSGYVDPNSQISNDIKEYLERNLTQKGIENKVVSILTVIGFTGALFFLSTNITGNVIGNLTNTTSNWLGGILFVLGIVGVYFWRR